MQNPKSALLRHSCALPHLHSSHFKISQRRILILAWNALIIHYGESPPPGSAFYKKSRFLY
jgi:hypothetical protein